MPLSLYRFLLLSSLVLITGRLSAQVPANPIGLNPPGLDWKEIKTDRVQVIFPNQIEPLAQRLASMVHYMWDNNTGTIGDDHIPISIMLHNQPVISNGFVTVGPFRSEFYASPPQYNQLSDWIDILAVHEYRHVMQFGNSLQGITRLASRTLGSWAWGGFAGAALPRWFFEGDAVALETAITGSGRGRLPSFAMEYRALLADNIQYGYEKASAGSLVDYVPNWYTLGYYLSTYARQRFGADIWEGVVRDAVRYKGLFYPFSNSLEERTGLSTPELYKETFMWLDSLWPAPETKSLRPGLTLNERADETVVNYNHPVDLGDGRVLVEKRGYNLIPAYYAVRPDGSEERITASGTIFDPLNTTLSFARNRFTWSELGFDLRWGNRNYSVISTYDMASGEKRRLTQHSRLYSPAFDHSARRIAAVELGQDMNMNLVILDAESGHILERLPNPEGAFLAFPAWLPDDSGIVLVAQKDERSGLRRVDIADGSWHEITPFSAFHLSHPFTHDDHIYYSSAEGGFNNIFAVHTESGRRYQLTDVYTGAFQPSVSPDGEFLYFSLFTRHGFDLQRIKLKEAMWEEVTDPIPDPQPLASLLSEQEGGSIINKVPKGAFEVKPYNKYERLINPHSLLPYGNPPVFGLELLSDNIFGTLSATAGGFYNVNEREFSLLASARYAALFPVLRTDYRLSHRSSFLLNYTPVNDTTLVQTAYNQGWVEHNAQVGTNVPLNFSAGNAITRLNVRALAGYQGVRPKGNIDREGLSRDTFVVNDATGIGSIIRPPLQRGSMGSLDLRADFQSYRRRALQHINPRWGINLSTQFRSTLWGKELSGQQWWVGGDIFLPGLKKDHSFYLNTQYLEEEILNNYQFSDIFFYPRGYRSQLGDRFLRIGLNYSLPLFYPDVALGPVAFVKRVKVNAFYDWGRSFLDFPFDSRSDIQSAGLELTVDFRLFRLLEIDAGIRYSYAFDKEATRNGQHHQFDFLLFSVSE